MSYVQYHASNPYVAGGNPAMDAYYDHGGVDSVNNLMQRRYQRRVLMKALPYLTGDIGRLKHGPELPTSERPDDSPIKIGDLNLNDQINTVPDIVNRLPKPKKAFTDKVDSNIKGDIGVYYGGLRMPTPENSHKKENATPEYQKKWRQLDYSNIKPLITADNSLDFSSINWKKIPEDVLTKNIVYSLAGQESRHGRNQSNPDGVHKGIYQINKNYWPLWTKQAGLPSSSPWTAENQRIVAENKIRHYLNMAGGDPSKVFLGWNGGPDEITANRPEAFMNREFPGNGSLNQYKAESMKRLVDNLRRKNILRKYNALNN